MTKKEYDKRIKQIEQEAKDKKFEVYKDYALANRKTNFKPGDIVKVGNTFLKIAKFSIDNFGKDYPSINYVCYILTQKLEMRKDKAVFTISEHKNIELIKEGK